MDQVKEEKKENNIQVESKENRPEPRKETRPVGSYYHPLFSMFNDFFGDDDVDSLMKTDITETEDAYLLEVELPGVDKKDVKISLDNGYLAIAAKVDTRGNQHGKVLRRERFSGSFKRSYYVGDRILKQDISASMENGILSIRVGKPAEKSEEEKYISIQ